MYRTILVPLDGSKRAEAILLHVESLARCYQSKLIFMQVVESPQLLVVPEVMYPALDQGEFDRWVQEAKDYLAALQKKFRERGFDVRTCLAYGAVVDEIIQVAEREHADLIAMTSHGRTGLAQVFLGSVAVGVLHRVKRPLLLIRA